MLWAYAGHLRNQDMPVLSIQKWRPSGMVQRCVIPASRLQRPGAAFERLAAFHEVLDVIYAREPDA